MLCDHRHGRDAVHSNGIQTYALEWIPLEWTALWNWSRPYAFGRRGL